MKAGLIDRVLRPVIDFVLPPHCAFCRQSLVLEAGATLFLCDDCCGAFEVDDREPCRRCGMPVGPHVSAAGPCLWCRAKRLRFSEVMRLNVYDGDLRSAVIRGKEPGGEAIAAALAELLYQRQLHRLTEFRTDVIVPVPQHWKKRLLAPHHEASIVADVLARRLGVRCGTGLVKKIRETPDQSSLPRFRRVTNLENAFEARGRELKGQRVLVVDDILTTGSTATEMARALKAHGAKEVAVAVIAVVE